MQQIIALSFLGFILLAVAYQGSRFSSFWGGATWLWALAIGLALVGAMVCVIMIMQANVQSTVGQVVYNASSIFIGVSTILLMVTLVSHLVFSFFKTPSWMEGAAVLGISALVSIYSLWNAGHVQVVPVEVEMPGLTKDMKVMQYTDVHLGHYWGKEDLDGIVDKTIAADVDAVVITGDLFDGRIRLDAETISPLKRLSCPVYFVSGNHDGYSGAREIKRILSEAGVCVLNNEMVVQDGLQIIGLDYMMPDRNAQDMMHAPLGGPTISEVLPALHIQKEKPAVLLHHNPIGARYAYENGIDLYMAGHTHAGQLFPINLINPYLFEYNQGMNQYKTTKVYVSHGSGTFGPPMRLGTRSEITLYTLRATI